MAPTNAYEVARWRARGGTHVIYRRASGQITAAGFADECLTAFCRDGSVAMGMPKVRQKAMGRYVDALLLRDGNICFFCLQPVTDEDVTVEHLVARGKGGPNHPDNLALAHDACNKKADNMTLMQKIRIRVEMEKAKILEQLKSSGGNTQ